MWDWIGLNLSVRSRVVQLTITEARVKELRDLADEALLHNLVSKKWLKSFAGKASSFASILILWRPFLRSIWAAIYAVPSDGTPQNCVWVKQFVVAVKWIRAFLNGVQGNMVRVFALDVYAGVGPLVCILLFLRLLLVCLRSLSDPEQWTFTAACDPRCK